MTLKNKAASLMSDENSTSDSEMSALQALKGIPCSKPRKLTASEIELLRRSKAEIGNRVRYLIQAEQRKS